MASRSSEPATFEARDGESQRLREENARLRRLLAAHGIAVPPSASDESRSTQPKEPPAAETKGERARKRIALFRSLFRGREDVYARRWDNPDGRHGYSRAALKDWKAINSSKPEDRKKVDKDTRRYLPLTDTVIETIFLGERPLAFIRSFRTRHVGL
jgi:hypothetical protein